MPASATLIDILVPILFIIIGVVPTFIYFKDRNTKPRPLFVILQVVLPSRRSNIKRYRLYVIFCNGSEKKLSMDHLKDGFPTITFPPECRILHCSQPTRFPKTRDFEKELNGQRIELLFEFLGHEDAFLISIDYEATASGSHLPEFPDVFENTEPVKIVNWKHMNKVHDYGAVVLFLVASMISYWLMMSDFSVASLAYGMAFLLSLFAFMCFLIELLNNHTGAIPDAAKEYLAGKGTSYIRRRNFPAR